MQFSQALGRERVKTRRADRLQEEWFVCLLLFNHHCSQEYTGKLTESRPAARSKLYCACATRSSCLAREPA